MCPFIAEARTILTHGVRNTPFCLNLSGFLPGALSEGPSVMAHSPASACQRYVGLQNTLQERRRTIRQCPHVPGVGPESLPCSASCPPSARPGFFGPQTYPRERHCPRGMVWVMFQAQHARNLVLPQPRSARQVIVQVRVRSRKFPRGNRGVYTPPLPRARTLTASLGHGQRRTSIAKTSSAPAQQVPREDEGGRIRFPQWQFRTGR